MPARALTLWIVCATALACSGGPRDVARASGPLDPKAALGSTAPRLAALGDRIVLSWIETDAAGGPALRFSLREGGTLGRFMRVAWSELH